MEITQELKKGIGILIMMLCLCATFGIAMFFIGQDNMCSKLGGTLMIQQGSNLFGATCINKESLIGLNKCCECPKAFYEEFKFNMTKNGKN